MGAPSVKVGTAPDTPPRGQVLARHLPPDRPYGRAGSVTLRQLSGPPLPLRVQRTRGGCGEPEADGGPRRATPAVWARSETPAPAMESGLAPRLLAAATGQAYGRRAGRAAERGTGDSPRPGCTGVAKLQYLGPADSPGRDTGLNRPHARPEPAPWEGPLVSDTTELFTGSSGTSEASQSGPDSGPSGAATPAGETVTDKPTRRGGSGLSGMKLADLQRIAQEMGITGTGRMRKGQLVEAIQARQAGGAAYAASSTPRQDGGAGHRRPGGESVNGQQAASSPAGDGSRAYDNSVQRGASAGAGAPRQREQDAMESDTPTQPALGDAGHASVPAQEAAATTRGAQRDGSRSGAQAGGPAQGQDGRGPAGDGQLAFGAQEAAEAGRNGQAEGGGRADGGGQQGDGQRRDRRRNGRRDDQARAADGGEQRDGGQRDSGQATAAGTAAASGTTVAGTTAAGTTAASGTAASAAGR